MVFVKNVASDFEFLLFNEPQLLSGLKGAGDEGPDSVPGMVGVPRSEDPCVAGLECVDSWI